MNYKQSKKSGKSCTVSQLKRIITILEEAKQPLLPSKISKQLIHLNGLKEGLNFLCRYGIIKREWMDFNKKGKSNSSYHFFSWHYSINYERNTNYIQNLNQTIKEKKYQIK